MSKHCSAVRAVTSEMKPVLIEALTHGWVASITGSGHVKLQHPRHGIVFTSCSTSDWRRPQSKKAATARRAWT